MPIGVLELTDADFVSVTGSGVVLVDFHGSWCPACRLLDPELEKLAAAYSGRIRIARLNVDENSEAAVDCLVEEIPTLIFFRDGREIERLFGAQTCETLADRLDRFLDAPAPETEERFS
ncbi:MAG: thioredoxin family protein [Planctomycetota bacterium]|jgi:thioredoxin 1|nr:thioredoxin family protein [Planctomycetota bacterium]